MRLLPGVVTPTLTKGSTSPCERFSPLMVLDGKPEGGDSVRVTVGGIIILEHCLYGFLPILKEERLKDPIGTTQRDPSVCRGTFYLAEPEFTRKRYRPPI
ncbi:hypothetical protein BLNAU_17062 [Blattamonas nauphoetae]|uniref:Uncharacterized protein n=1 Tax=Blattamonas nauphoetae TaxID=2049346 RepID=A0ABQ9XCK8_9EUKA|nr:hypothetical protein BLNAU_17062 [Blattamonas nauphoetae]